MISLNKELKEVKGEKVDLLSEQEREYKKVEKQFDKRAVRKAEKILKGDVKERVSFSQRFEIAKMNFQNKVEDLRQDNEGQLVRPVLKAAGQTVVSGISKGFSKIVSAVKEKFAEKAEDNDQESRDVAEWCGDELDKAAELLDETSAELTDGKAAETEDAVKGDDPYFAELDPTKGRPEDMQNSDEAAADMEEGQ